MIGNLVYSDTDTDSENKKPYFTNLTKSNSNLERNASNSSADFTERLFNKSDPLKETMDQNDSDISSDFENDNELNTLEEAENWWSFTQGQREEETTKKEIKRQENIYEFIHTELNHSKTLRIMQVCTIHFAGFSFLMQKVRHESKASE